MEKIFGIPLNGVMLYLSVVLGVVLLTLIALGIRHFVLVKLGLRNIPRRKAQTSLIILGLMLSTLIITAALGVGDTISYSIKDQAITNLGNLDIYVAKAPSPTAALLGNTDAQYFKPDEYTKLKSQIEANDKVKLVIPTIFVPSGVINETQQLTRSDAEIAAVTPEFSQAWGELKTSSGKTVSVADLAPGEVYTSKELNQKLNIKPGDVLQVYIEKKPVTLKVKDTLDRDIDGSSPKVLMNLVDYQQRANRAGQVQQVWMSLKDNGTLDSRIDNSNQVTRYLRVALSDNKAMGELKALLSQPAIMDKLDEQTRKLQDADPSKERLTQFRAELAKPEVTDEFKRLSQDTLVMGQLAQLSGKFSQEQTGQLFRLSATLSAYRVQDEKASAIDLAELIGSEFTAFFTIFALFSISVGILLIFLIFVMLATERKAEMGMARALGIKRRHLTEMFVFEGTIYSMLAAVVGVIAGVAVGAGLVQFMATLVSGEGFTLRDHIEPRSLIISFCLGMVLTFIVVAFSSYRVSRLNIVAAIRDLEEDGKRGKSLVYILLRPFRITGHSFKQLFKLHPLAFLSGMTIGLTNSLFGIVMALFTRGPLAILLGVQFAAMGVEAKAASLYTLGVSLIIIGLGLLVRWIMKSLRLKNDLADRVGYSLAGLLLVFYWARPFGDNFFEKALGLEDTLHLKEMSNSIDLFFISGMMLVMGAIWALMYNSDLIIKGLMLVSSRVKPLAPITRTALAYPLTAKFRTGMLLAMFSLVTFVIIFMSVFVDLNNKLFEDKDRSSGGWDIVAASNPTNPVSDINAVVASNPALKDQIGNLSQTIFSQMGQYQALEVTAKNPTWGAVDVQAADDTYFQESKFKFYAKADGYTGDQQIMDAVRTQPNLAVLPSWLQVGNSGNGPGQFGVTTLDPKDKSFKSFEIQVRDQRSGSVKNLTVIGFVDKPYFTYFPGILVSKNTLAAIAGVPVEQLKANTYFFDVKPGADIEAARITLGKALAANGIEPKNIAEEIRKSSAIGAGFNTLFQLFAGLGLLVGIAGLGVISTRVVVERRQQIGMLRAIGFSRRLVQMSFLLESSFIAVLGLVLGGALGLWSAYKFTGSFGQFDFSIPWTQVILILVGSYLATLLTTYLPARAAAKVYPAEALRYE